MDRVVMINWITGTEMSVPVDLVDRFLAAGHKLAAPPEKPKTATRKHASKAKE